jgi:hypothetical protein
MKLAGTTFSVILSATVATAGGCGTLYYGTSEKIPVRSDPSGAAVLVDGEPVGDTPVTVKLSRKHIHKIQIQKTGYITYETTTETTSNDTALLSDAVPAMVFPPIILLLFGEYETGAAYKIVPSKIDAHLLTAASTNSAVSTPAAAASPGAAASPAAASTPAAAISSSAAPTPAAAPSPSATPEPAASASPTASPAPAASPSPNPTPSAHG